MLDLNSIVSSHLLTFNTCKYIFSWCSSQGLLQIILHIYEVFETLCTFTMFSTLWVPLNLFLSKDCIVSIVTNAFQSEHWHWNHLTSACRILGWHLSSNSFCWEKNVNKGFLSNVPYIYFLSCESVFAINKSICLVVKIDEWGKCICHFYI